MSWQHLTELEQWKAIQSASFEQPQVVFKHSTRCSISSMALNRFEHSELFKKDMLACWYLDLIRFRSISDQIAFDTHIQHESPQCLLIKNGEVHYAASHGMIDDQTILDKI